MYKIQNIIFPPKDLLKEEELYYRKSKNMYIDDNKSYIEFKKNDCLSFDTYFNCFSSCKWFQYTNLQNIKLKLVLKGSFKVSLFALEKSENEVINKCISERSCHSNSYKEFIFDFTSISNLGLIYFSLESLEDNSCFCCDASYEADFLEMENDINLAIIICTYRREEYITQNLRRLKSHFLENEKSDLQKKIKILVIDNGNTLESMDIESENIYLIKNKNTGGSGGFTRGMIEVIRDKKFDKITHLLLMDDDVIISIEAIYRTFKLLTYLKNEYKTSFVGGAMLRTDLPYIQTESGALWNKGNIINKNGNTDLRRIENCVNNEEDFPSDYNAWWFCVIPRILVSEDNLPLPLFIRGDDVEYGLRNMKNLILMNGICIWHEPFDKKISSSLFYYIFRNKLIINSIHNISYKYLDFIKDLGYQFFREVFLFRYINANLLLEGVRDYLRGINWLIESDGYELNKRINHTAYQLKNMEHVKVLDNKNGLATDLTHKKVPRIIRLITLNGLFIKSTLSIIEPYNEPNLNHYFKASKVINYDFENNKGFETNKSIILCLKLIIKYMYIIFLFLIKYKFIRKKYMQNKTKLTSLDFWTKYLDDCK